MGALDVDGEITSQRGGDLTTGDKNFGVDSFGPSIASQYFDRKSIESLKSFGVVGVVVVSITVVSVAWINRNKKRGK